MPEIAIPVPLRRYCENSKSVAIAASTVGDALRELIEKFPQLRPYIFDDTMNTRPFINIFVEGEDVRMIDGFDTVIEAGDRIEILPAIAGGSRDASDWRSHVEEAVRSIGPAEAVSAVDDALLIDVRTAGERAQGYIPGAVHVDRGFLEMQIVQTAENPDRPIICYCQSGVRSLMAASTLVRMGYSDVSSLAGGFERWKEEGREIVMPDPVSGEKLQRYQRHLAIPEIGESGQASFGAGRVAIVGMGGLGCPVSLYLAAAGVGTLALIDNDHVDLSNLQRQILYTPDMIGRSKAGCAESVLARFNPSIALIPFEERLDYGRAVTIFADHDIVVDCTDNFSSRYLINDAAVATRRPVVHGAVYRFDAQVSVFGLDDGPCYRCFLPEPPPAELAPSCAEAGVLGVLPGAAGLLMATEVLKLLAGVGDPLSGRMACYDGLSGAFREVRFRRNPSCPQCGQASAEQSQSPAAAQPRGDRHAASG